MASHPAIVSVGLLDALGVPVSFDLYVLVDDAVNVGTLVSWSDEFLPVLDAVTGSQITSITVKQDLPLPGSGIKTTPDAASENERTGLFNFSQATVKYKDGVDVPGLKESLIVDGKIDLTASAVTDWVAFVTTTADTIQPVSKFQYALVALKDALISFRKHRKAESRRSLEKA